VQDLTTEANELMRPLHDRMPVILPEEHFAQWLDSKKEEVAELASLLKP
jgi:putative SOS response-associated peptidase YedK